MGRTGQGQSAWSPRCLAVTMCKAHLHVELSRGVGPPRGLDLDCRPPVGQHAQVLPPHHSPAPRGLQHQRGALLPDGLRREQGYEVVNISSNAAAHMALLPDSVSIILLYPSQDEAGRHRSSTHGDCTKTPQINCIRVVCVLLSMSGAKRPDHVRQAPSHRHDRVALAAHLDVSPHGAGPPRRLQQRRRLAQAQEAAALQAGTPGTLDGGGGALLPQPLQLPPRQEYPAVGLQAGGKLTHAGGHDKQT